jgi:large subunit ribosomal protein L28
LQQFYPHLKGAVRYRYVKMKIKSLRFENEAIYSSPCKHYFKLIVKYKDEVMARVCDLTGKRRLVGNKVSHANNKTKMTQKPNLQTKRVYDPVTGQTIKLRLSTRAIRTLDKVGSLQKFLKKYKHLWNA